MDLKSRVLVGAITILFVWSSALVFINKQPVRIPQISFSEQLFQDVASSLRFESNRLFTVIHDFCIWRWRMDVGMDGRGRGPERAHTEWAWVWAWSVEVKQSKGKHVPKFRSQEICCTKKKHL